jgi:hypothetical protein
MKVIDPKSNQVIDLATQTNPNEAISGLLSGQLLADQNSTYKLKTPAGKVIDVQAEDLGPLLNMGATFFGAQEQAKAAEEEKFSGIPQQAAAAGLGALRGVSLGLSDVLLGKTGIVSPEYLQKQEEYNPEIGTAGEVAGMVLPAVLSGGESVAAKALAKTPAALIPELGAAAGELVSPIAKAAGKLSPIASKAVETAVKTGIGSAVEGAAYGAGKALSEDTIQNKPFTAESVLSGMGTGALINGLMGVGLGAGGELVAEGAKKAISKISDLASDEKMLPTFIARSLGSSKKNMTQILGSESKMENIVDAYKAMHSDINMVPSNVGSQGAKEFADSFKSAAESPVGVSKILENVDDTLKRAGHVKEQAGNAINNTIESVQARSSTEEVLNAMNEAKKHVGEFDFATQDKLKSYLDRLEGVLSDVDSATGDISFKDLSAKELWEARKSIDDVIFNSKDLSVLGRTDNPFTNALTKGRAQVEAKLEDLVKAEGKEAYDAYKVSKKAYSGASDIEKLALSQQAKNANNIIGLTDYISGGAGASIGGAPGAIAGIALRKATRDYGDRAIVSILTQLEKNSGKMTSVIDDSIKGLFKAGKTAGAIATVKGVEALDKHDSYEEKLNKFTDNANSIENVQQRLDQVLVGVGAAAPETALALRDKTLNAMNFLASKLPKHPIESSMVKYQIPESELDKFNRYSEAVNNPQSIIKNLKGGYISPEEVEVLKKVYPEINQKLQSAAIEALSKKNKDINYQLRLQLQKLMDNKQEVNMYPRGVMTLQSNFAGQPAGQMPIPGQKLPGARAKNMNLSGSTDTGLQATLKRRND